MVHMIAAFYSQHATERPSCQELDVAIHQREKRGLCWKITMQCQSCRYISKPFDLYKEAKQEKRGPNPGALNVAMAIALQDSPVGSERFSDILRTMGVSPPTKKTMQKLLNKAGEAVKDLNTKDMSEKISLIK